MMPLTAAQARAVASDAATDSYRQELVAAVDTTVVPLQQQASALGGTTTYRQSPLATRLIGATIGTPGRPSGYGRASVAVWTLLTISQTGHTPNGDAPNASGSFSTIYIDLLWQRGAWRVDDITEAAGPTPLIDGTPTTGKELDTQLHGFTPWPAP